MSDFALRATSGAEIDLYGEKPPATVVVFTCNHCPYALAWHDRINKLAIDYARLGVRVLQINPNGPDGHPAESLEEMQRRVARGDFAGPYIWDEEQKVTAAWGVQVTPEIFVLDDEYVVRYRGAADGSYYDESQNACWVREALDHVLKDEAVKRPSTRRIGCSVKWRVEILYWAGCPSLEAAEAALHTTLRTIGRAEVPVRRKEVRSKKEAEQQEFVGSPTFRVGTIDLFPPDSDSSYSLTCRLYKTSSGGPSPMPDTEQLSTALRRALQRPDDRLPDLQVVTKPEVDDRPIR